MSFRYSTIILSLAVSAAATVVTGDDSDPQGSIKQFTGISIVGDREAPRSLYIVPWHKTEHKQNTSLTSRLAESNLQPMDRESFRLQLRLYELNNAGWHSITPDER